MIRFVLRATVAATTLATLVAPAFAHATFEVPQAAPGGT